MILDKQMLNSGIRVINRRGLCYTAEGEKNVRRFKPWLGDAFSFLYDVIMKHTIFPKKFGGDMIRHYEILRQTLKNIPGKRVLELATGSGSAVHFLPNDKAYTGTDISPGLLRRAVKRFNAAGFEDTEFYVTSSADLPFADHIFSICLCILSLNFFDDVDTVFQEVKRVLVPGAVFICSVPVPERNRLQSTIRGTLYSEKELAGRCKAHGFEFESLPFENGALLYFTASILG